MTPSFPQLNRVHQTHIKDQRFWVVSLQQQRQQPLLSSNKPTKTPHLYLLISTTINMSSDNSTLLKAHPKAEGESWETWGERLAQKYPTPAVTPDLPLVPGYDNLRAYFLM